MTKQTIRLDEFATSYVTLALPRWSTLACGALLSKNFRTIWMVEGLVKDRLPKSWNRFLLV
jgi:hypothetical protein